MLADLNETANRIAKEVVRMCGDGGLEKLGEITNMLYGASVELMLEKEMDEHLGYTKHDNAGDKTGNSRNGYTTKTIKSEWGEVTIKVPRDRNGTFVPTIVPKSKRRTGSLEDHLLAMHKRGMSDREIANYAKELFGVELSPSVVNRIVGTRKAEGL
ncbi:MAG: transposase [Clostridiales bacterium]|jgi:transposase-like protein|nr:transposase [Clostridiales bacterium]